MKKLLFLVIIICSSLQLFAQHSNYEIELPCDTLDTQTEMNICSYRKSRILDSIMNSKYTCIISDLEAEKSHYEDLQDTMMVSNCGKLIESLTQSQKKWDEMAEQNMEFYSAFYEGGSIRPLVVNMSMISDLIDRLEKLDAFVATINQGRDSKICN
jgi:uncharacterized protein YecT (DUF1311 family)